MWCGCACLSLLLITALGASKSHSEILRVDEEESKESLADAVDVLIKRIVKYNFQTINVITAVNDTVDSQLSPLKTGIFRKNRINYAVKISNFMKIKDEYPLRKRYSIFLLDNIENFRTLSREITKKKFQLRGVYLLVFVNGLIEEHHEIFATMWSKSIGNIYSLYETRDGEIFLSTISPFEHHERCGDTRPKVINQYVNGTFIKKVNFFRAKFTQMNACPVNVVTFEDNVTNYLTDHQNGTFTMRGPCIDLMSVISRELNFTIDVKLLREPSAWGTIFKNGTMTGALSELQSETADIALGFYYLRLNRMRQFDRSTILLAMPLVLVVPPGSHYTSIEKLLQPFHWIVWLLLLLTFVIGILVILVISLKYKSHKTLIYGENVESPALNMIAALLGLGQTVVPDKSFARLLLMTFLLFCLVMRNTYQGLLYRFIQSDGRHKEVQSFTEMVDKNFTFYAHESEMDLIENFRVLQGRVQFFTNESFLFHRALRENERVGVIDALLDILVINENNRHRFQHKLYRQRLILNNIVFYMRSSFFLSTAINDKIDVILASGLMLHWMKRVVDYEAILARREAKQEPKVMSLHELMGPFIVLFTLHSIALVVFCFELLVHRIKMERVLL